MRLHGITQATECPWPNVQGLVGVLLRWAWREPLLATLAVIFVVSEVTLILILVAVQLWITVT